MSRLSTSVAGVSTESLTWHLTEQIIGGAHGDDMTEEILREVTTIENIEEATSEYWVCVRPGAHVGGAKQTKKHVKQYETGQRLWCCLAELTEAGVWGSIQRKMQVLW